MKKALQYSIVTLLLFSALATVGEAQVSEGDIEKAYERFYESAAVVKEVKTVSAQKEFLFSAINLFSLQYKATQNMVEKQSFIPEEKRESIVEDIEVYRKNLSIIQEKLEKAYGSYEVYNVSRDLYELRELYKYKIQKDILLTYFSSFESSVISPLKERAKDLSGEGSITILKNISKIESIFNEVKDILEKDSFSIKGVVEKIDEINSTLKETYKQFRNLSIQIKEERIGVGVFQ